jgi:quinol monooxygenase YgiN
LPDAGLPAFTLAEFLRGQTLQEYTRDLSTHQPDFPLLLAESVLPSTAAQRMRDSGARFAALITEAWCPDSLHTIPVLVRVQEAVPELEVRVWRRSEHPELVLSIAGEPVGGKTPSVPHVALYDADFGELGHFRERPASVTSWLDEESRHFRARLRLQERRRVRTETLAGLLAAAEERPPPAKPTEGRPLTVYEYWEANDPALRETLETALKRHMPALNVVPGVRSVDFTELKTRPGRYLALFRYADEGVRSSFLSSEAVRALRAEVDPLWTRVSETTWSYGL